MKNIQLTWYEISNNNVNHKSCTEKTTGNMHSILIIFRYNRFMTVAQKARIHINQLVPEIMGQAFPEIDGLPVVAEYSGDTDAYADADLSEGFYTITLAKDLEDAPLPVLRGALAEELGKIAKFETISKISLFVQSILLGLSDRYAARFSRLGDMDLIRRGLGEDYLAYSRYLRDQFGYEHQRFDGYKLEDLEPMVKSARL